jgi:hypothetical protein
VRREQRASVIERFTYEAGMRRVIGQVHRLLAASARHAGSADKAGQANPAGRVAA